MNNKNRSTDKSTVWLTPKELYRKFGIAIATQAQYRSDRKIPFHKIGSKIYYKLSDIDDWIDEAKVNWAIY